MKIHRKGARTRRWPQGTLSNSFAFSPRLCVPAIQTFAFDEGRHDI
jgi:hypothetical protein